MAAVAARGTLITLVGNIAGVVIGAIGILLTARVLTPAEYGQYTITLLPVTLLNLLSGLGIDQALPRFLVQSRTHRTSHEIRDLIYAGLGVKMLTATGLAILQFLFADPIAQLLNRPEITRYIQIAALSVAVQPLYTTILTVFAGINRMTRRALVSLLQTICKSILVPLLVFLGVGVAGAVIGYVTSFYFAVAVGVGAIFVIVMPPRFGEITQVLRSQIPQLIRFGFPLFMGALLSSILTQIGRTLLPWYVSDAVIGNYQVAAQFTALITVFTSALAITLYPSFSRFSFQSSASMTRHAYRMAVRYSALIVIPLTLLLVAVAQPLIATLYATRYPLAANFFVVMLVPMMFVALGQVVAPAFLTSQGDPRGSAVIALVQSGLGLALAPLGLYLASAMGFIIAQTIASGVGIMYGVIRLRLRFQISPDFGFLVRLFGSVLIAKLATLGIGQVGSALPASGMLIVSAVTFIGVILVSMPMTKALTLVDLGNLERFAGSMSIVGTLILLFVRVEKRLTIWIQRAHDA